MPVVAPATPEPFTLEIPPAGLLPGRSGCGLPAEPLQLLPQRAAFVPAQGWLLVADAHIGKGSSFRRLGVPVPGGTTAGTLARLDAALAVTGARGIAFLGDLLHSRQGRSGATLEAVERWRARHPGLELVLVRGNHDRHAGDPPPGWGVRCVEEPWRVGNVLALAHHPARLPGAYVLAGHVHPAAALHGRAGQRLRLPCFHFEDGLGLLPAFGEFTGSHLVHRSAAGRTFVIAEDLVRELPAPPRPRLGPP